MDVDSDTEVEALSTSSQPTSRLSNIDGSMWKTIALGAIVIILLFSNTIWELFIQSHNPIVEPDVIPNDPFKKHICILHAEIYTLQNRHQSLYSFIGASFSSNDEEIVQAYLKRLPDYYDLHAQLAKGAQPSHMTLLQYAARVLLTEQDRKQYNKFFMKVMLADNYKLEQRMAKAEGEDDVDAWKRDMEATSVKDNKIKENMAVICQGYI